MDEFAFLGLVDDLVAEVVNHVVGKEDAGDWADKDGLDDAEDEDGEEEEGSQFPNVVEGVGVLEVEDGEVVGESVEEVGVGFVRVVVVLDGH